MSRELKFRAWDPQEKVFYPPVITENGKSGVLWYGYELQDENDDPIMQYVGLKDKNGTEIYDGDLLRCIHTLSEGKWISDAIYKVFLCPYSGIKANYKKLYYDDNKNQIPIIQELSFKNGSLCVDFRNSKYENICIDDYSCGSDIWNRYSNDIEVIGNIYENPEFLEKKS